MCQSYKEVRTRKQLKADTSLTVGEESESDMDKQSLAVDEPIRWSDISPANNYTKPHIFHTFHHHQLLSVRPSQEQRDVVLIIKMACPVVLVILFLTLLTLIHLKYCRNSQEDTISLAEADFRENPADKVGQGKELSD